MSWVAPGMAAQCFRIFASVVMAPSPGRGPILQHVPHAAELARVARTEVVGARVGAGEAGHARVDVADGEAALVGAGRAARAAVCARDVALAAEGLHAAVEVALR